ncbi:MAG: hypothetical protein HFE61_11095 [Anaerotignum sp.]|jgi:DNA-binding beta-propeller fold protein YncE|nr:hypothetical protein [Anaerotignum sp.]
MDGFILYMKKRKPPYFFFFNEFVVFRYSKKTEIVNRENGTMIAELNVGNVSEAVYSSKHTKLFLKSISNGYLYVFDFNNKELKKLFKISEYDKGIFLSYDENTLVAYAIYGIIQTVSVDTLETALLTDERTQYFFFDAWDNPLLKCYEFFGRNSNILSLFLRLDYNGKIIAEELVTLDSHEVICPCSKLSAEKNLYISQCRIKNISDSYERTPDSIVTITKSPNAYGNTDIILKGTYAGGCYYITQYRNYVFLSIGDKNIYVIDIDKKRILKKYEIASTTTIAEYDPKRNILFVSTGGGKVHILEDVL